MESERDDVETLTIEVRNLTNELRQQRLNGNVQTLIVKNQGLGSWTAAAVTACFLTYLSLLLFAAYILPEIHDLGAWKDIHSAKIASKETPK